MDSTQANQFAAQLIAEEKIGEWHVTELLGYGKSAVVMRGTNGKLEAAIKVFHPDLIAEYGLESQKIRIEREKLLISHSHPSIVKIIDGGISQPHERPYVVMELIIGKTLSDVIQNIPSENVAKLISDLAEAVKYLEDMGIVHRDIKPDNIMVTDENYQTLKLLDFGVLKPIGDNSATNQHNHKTFLGTHQYCPPEMIHIKQADTMEDWRAISFYQIGGVMHDLIMQKRLFQESNDSIANLVMAINQTEPLIENSKINPKLVTTAKICLKKNPKDRLFISWEDFQWSDELANNNNDRKKALGQLQHANKTEVIKFGLERVETTRLENVKMANLVRLLRQKVDSVYTDLSDHLPVRTISIIGQNYPNPTIHSKFNAAANLNIKLPFTIELTVESIVDSSFIRVYTRANEGESSTEISWSALGEFLYELDGFNERFESWIITILEQLIIKQNGV